VIILCPAVSVSVIRCWYTGVLSFVHRPREITQSLMPAVKLATFCRTEWRSHTVSYRCLSTNDLNRHTLQVKLQSVHF